LLTCLDEDLHTEIDAVVTDDYFLFSDGIMYFVSAKAAEQRRTRAVPRVADVRLGSEWSGVPERADHPLLRVTGMGE
jgi:hypothetical protein